MSIGRCRYGCKRSSESYLSRYRRRAGAKCVSTEPSPFNVGDRVFHQKFGSGNIIDGNKLTIDFDKAGQRKVLDGFVRGVMMR